MRGLHRCSMTQNKQTEGTVHTEADNRVAATPGSELTPQVHFTLHFTGVSP